MGLSPWKAARLDGLTSSDAASVLGYGFSTPYQVWAEKRRLVEPVDLSNNEAVYFGNLLEPITLAEYAKRTKRELIPTEVWARALPSVEVHALDDGEGVRHLLVNRAVPWLRTTPDAFAARWTPLLNCAVQVDPGGFGYVEAKAYSAFAAKGFGASMQPFKGNAPEVRDLAEIDSRVPLSVAIQLQHGLLATGLRWGSVPVLLGGQELRTFDHPRSEKFAAYLFRRLDVFWRDYVNGDLRPNPNESPGDARAIRALYPEENGETIVLPKEWAAIDERRVRALAAGRLAKRLSDRLGNRLRDAIGDASLAEIDGTAVTYTYFADKHGARRLNRKERKWRPKKSSARGATA